jgi:DnaJ like chaperone protein
MENNDWTLYPVVLTLFFFGYWLVSYFMRDRGAKPGPDAGSTVISPDSESDEQRNARILGLTNPYSVDDIKSSYRAMLAQYHPDKVNHLGEEIRSVADRKTREIMEAYEYFRKEYRIRS